MEISRGTDTLNDDQASNCQQTTAPESNNSRGWGFSEPILLEPCRVRQDVRLAQRAVKHRWPMKRAKCRGLVDRLFAIAEKTVVSVVTRTGDMEAVEGPADVNSISAARVLVAMTGQNQSDEHHADDLDKPDASVNVAVESTHPVKIYLPDNGRSLIDLPDDERRTRIAAILDRIRTGHTAADAAGGETVAMRAATPVEVARYALALHTDRCHLGATF